MSQPTPSADGASAQASLHSQVRSQLQAAISDGTYPPGSRLPTEQELCGLFGVSRITVRQALADLQVGGLLEKVHGRGSFVRRAKAFQNITELEGFSEAMTPRGHQVRNRLHGFKHLSATADLAAFLQLPKGARVTEIARVRLLDGAPISFERTFVAESLGEELAAADLVTRDLFQIMELDHGLSIGHAEVTIDAQSVDEVLSKELQARRGEPILRVERHVFEQSGKPLAFEILYFRADTFQYRIRIDRVKRGSCAAETAMP